MSRFLTRLALIQTGWHKECAKRETLAPLTNHSQRLGRTLVVPERFITDLPYQFGVWPPDDGERVKVDRCLAEAVFRESLESDEMGGAGPVARRIIWLAVRLSGMFTWRGRRAPELSPIWSSQGLPAELAAQEAT